MSYNTVQFVLFFIAFVLVYLSMPTVKLRQAVILIGNLIFYRYTGGLNALLFLLIASVSSYLSAIAITKIYGDYPVESEGLSLKESQALFNKYKNKASKYLYLSLAISLGILLYTKVGRLLGWTRVSAVMDVIPFQGYLVPLGISYYTLSMVGYVLDVFWNKCQAERNYLKFLMCSTFFPVMVQGPIIRYPKLLNQFEELSGFDYKRVTYGIQLMLWGFIKKSVIADRLAAYPQTIFSDINSYAGVEVVLGVIFNVIVLYADFSGCMDIVIGASKIMGITLDNNFRRPFFSKSPAEFWRRWHITLGLWFKDYVYMPISTNHDFIKIAGKLRKYAGSNAQRIFSTGIPLLIVWILTGLWHGTGADYIMWGIYWGCLIIIETILSKQLHAIEEYAKKRKLIGSYNFVRMLLVFIMFSIGRMFTALGSGTAGGVKIIMYRILLENRIWTLFDGSLYTHGVDQKNFYICLTGILAMWAVGILQEKYTLREQIANQLLPIRWAIYYMAIAIILVFGIYGSVYDASSFVYGGF